MLAGEKGRTEGEGPVKGCDATSGRGDPDVKRGEGRGERGLRKWNPIQNDESRLTSLARLCTMRGCRERSGKTECML